MTSVLRHDVAYALIWSSAALTVIVSSLAESSHWILLTCILTLWVASGGLAWWKRRRALAVAAWVVPPILVVGTVAGVVVCGAPFEPLEGAPAFVKVFWETAIELAKILVITLVASSLSAAGYTSSLGRNSTPANNGDLFSAWKENDP